MSQLCCLKIMRMLWPIRTPLCQWQLQQLWVCCPVDNYHEANNRSRSQNRINFWDKYFFYQLRKINVRGELGVEGAGGFFLPPHAWLYPSRADGSDVTCGLTCQTDSNFNFLPRGPRIPSLHFALKQAQAFLCKRESDRTGETSSSTLNRCDRTSSQTRFANGK